MSRILVFTVLLAGLTLLGTSLPSRAPAEQDTNKKPVVKEKPVVKDVPITPQSLIKALLTTVTFPEEADPKTTLVEILERVSKLHHVPITINERAFKAEMLNDVLKTEIANPNPIPQMKTTLWKVISRILERVSVPSSATFLVREDGIEITTGQFVGTEIQNEREQPHRAKASLAGTDAPMPGGGKGPPTGGTGPAIGKGPAKGGAPLNPLDEERSDRRFWVAPVSIAVEHQPLEEALRQMRLEVNINFVVDPALGEKARTALTLTLLNAPLDNALRVLMEMTELDFVWLGNIFYITNRDKAQKLRTTWPARRSGGVPVLFPSAGGAGM